MPTGWRAPPWQETDHDEQIAPHAGGGVTTTHTDVGTLPGIDHTEGMALAETEYSRLLDVVDQLNEQDWPQPTDCDPWDVKAMLCHVLGGMERDASPRAAIRERWLATRASKRSGRPFVDEMTALEVREHAHLSPDEIAKRLHEMAPRALRGRRRMPAAMRSMAFRPGPPTEGKWTYGFLVDVILNRDNWMHRIDLTRATGKPLVLSAEHDGRIVADVVAEWARAHGQPFELSLTGPAGGSFFSSEPTTGEAEQHQLDAVEFCRILSGRDQGSGLLNQFVTF
jgi:uncharacterized protein (TIGR03083 family)